MTKTYTHLGIFSDMVEEARRQQALYPRARPGEETRRKVREVLGWCDLAEDPLELRVEKTWEESGLTGEELSWSVGYGPRTQAWFFRPAGPTSPLPGVLALHDHSGFKFYGKEKIADGSAPLDPSLRRFREVYGGRAWVNALAREGFAVLVHDTFLWGSRKFPLDLMKAVVDERISADQLAAEWNKSGVAEDIAEYNFIAGQHEHWVSKYCNILGTNLAGVVAHEDRIALNVLRSRQEVDAQNVACMGLSGGGNRAGLLRASADGLKAAAAICLMCTYPELLDHNMSHTWMLFPFGWSRFGDWPDLVACQAPAALLVQYALDDDLFTVKGMRDAHAILEDHYRNTGTPQAYTGQFYSGGHRFDLAMQQAAFGWLKQQLFSDQISADRSLSDRK
jgi:dienelactone hydrolase